MLPSPNPPRDPYLRYLLPRDHAEWFTMLTTTKSRVRAPPVDTNVALVDGLLAVYLPPMLGQPSLAYPTLLCRQVTGLPPTQPRPPFPHPSVRSHCDDLGVELCRQGTCTGLGMEEAVKGLHGTGCHQLQRTWRLVGNSLRRPRQPWAPPHPTPAGGLRGRPGPPESQTCPRRLDTQTQLLL